MVYGIIARGLSKAARDYGPGFVKGAFKQFKKYDVSIHRQLYGQSGGRGVRHGRDAGSLIAGTYQGLRGDDLDNGKGFSPPSGPFRKERSGRGNKYGSRFNKYSSNYRNGRRCKPCKPYRGGRR